MKFLSLLLIFTFSGLGSCLLSYPTDYVQFIKLSEGEREQELKKLSLEKQVEYFEYCVPTTTCDKFYYQVIPSRGKAAVPYLIDHLDSVSDGTRYADSILIEAIDERFERLNDSETVKGLNRIVDKMQDPTYKRMVQRNLKNIIPFPEGEPELVP